MRDWMNKDPKLRKKIVGITLLTGYHCLSSCYCDCSHKCKYRKINSRLHNFRVCISRFLHLNYISRIHIAKNNVDLSGTEKCPFKKERIYTCWDCRYSYGMRGCSNEKWRTSSWEESQHPTNRYVCKFFEKNDYADNYDKKTGERIV